MRNLASGNFLNDLHAIALSNDRRTASQGSPIGKIVTAASGQLSEPGGIALVPPKCARRDATR